jgi:hypothetical protein
MSDCRLPIREFVEGRSKELGIRRGELARRCGFKNVDKGIRRCEAMCDGDLDSSSARMILNALPAALEVDEVVVAAAVRESGILIERARRRADAERDAAWRASFKPHAYLIGSETRPWSITMYGISGGSERWLRISLDCTRPSVTYATQALSVVRKTPVVRFFGATTGFIVNYTPDRAARFDLDGNPIEVLPKAYSPGDVELQIGRRRISGHSFMRIMGVI